VRRPDDRSINRTVHVGVGARAAAAPRGRYDLFSYAVVDAYARSFTRAGFGDAVQAIRAGHGAGDRARAWPRSPGPNTTSVPCIEAEIVDPRTGSHLLVRSEAPMSSAGSRPLTERSQALPETTSELGTAEWVACHCCGLSFPASRMVRFRNHPSDGLCVGCAEWLYACSRAIVRRAYPILQVPARIRAWMTPSR
jgi:hypothetical protein